MKLLVLLFLLPLILCGQNFKILEIETDAPEGLNPVIIYTDGKIIKTLEYRYNKVDYCVLNLENGEESCVEVARFIDPYLVDISNKFDNIYSLKFIRVKRNSAKLYEIEFDLISEEISEPKLIHTIAGKGKSMIRSHPFPSYGKSENGEYSYMAVEKLRFRRFRDVKIDSIRVDVFDKEFNRINSFTQKVRSKAYVNISNNGTINIHSKTKAYYYCYQKSSNSSALIDSILYRGKTHQILPINNKLWHGYLSVFSENLKTKSVFYKWNNEGKLISNDISFDRRYEINLEQGEIKNFRSYYKERKEADNLSFSFTHLNNFYYMNLDKGSLVNRGIKNFKYSKIPSSYWYSFRNDNKTFLLFDINPHDDYEKYEHIWLDQEKNEIIQFDYPFDFSVFKVKRIVSFAYTENRDLLLIRYRTGINKYKMAIIYNDKPDKKYRL